MKENKCWKILCSAPFFCFSLFLFFQLQRRYSLPFFVFVFHAAVLLQPSFSFLFVCCPLFFSPKYFFFSPNIFQLFSPKTLFFRPKRFCFSPKLFSVQPKTFFFFFSSSATLLFFFFLFYSFLVQTSFFFSLSVPPFFLFFSSVYPRPNILSSCFTSLLFE